MSKKTPHSTKQHRRIFPWVAIIALVTGLAVMTAIYWQQNLKVSQVVVEGNYYTPSALILQKAEVPLGIHPDSLDLSAVVQQVQSLDYIHTVVPFIDPLGKLTLTVYERRPIALLVNGTDEIYVDAYGVRLPIIPEKTQNLPLVYGFDARLQSDTLNSPAFRQVRDFLVGAMNNKFGWATISEVAYDPEVGVIALSHENGVKLLFGVNDFDIKLRNWEAFYSQVIRVKGIQAIQQVDLRFTNQVVTKEVES